jgi:hypothetical protein
MKSRIVTAGAFVVLGLVAAFAQNKPVKVNLDDPAQPAAKAGAKPATPPAAKTDPAKPAPKADAKKKADEMGTITGVEIPRGDGFMGIELVSGTFKLSFYNAKKKPIAPDVDRAALKWTVKTQSLPERVVLNVDGNALTSPKVIKPPYTFSLAITLFKGEGDAATTENFSVAFSQ